MRDVNWVLRQAYTTALADLSVKAYYQLAPAGYTDDYVVFRSINSNDASTKNSSDTNTTIVVEIHTHKNGSNNGRNADQLADDIYQRIYAIKQYNLVLFGMQMVYTNMISDNVGVVLLQHNRNYISRFITFRHNIFIDGNGGNNNPVITIGGVFRMEYTAAGGEDIITSADLVGATVLEAVKDGIGFAKLITSGTPVDKEALVNSGAGSVQFAVTFAPNEVAYIIYKK